MIHAHSKVEQRAFPDARPRILVVEDHWLVSLQAELMLKDLGCDVVGPASTVEEGCHLARDSDISGALLDVSLGDEYSFAIADILAARSIPFAFATGYAGDFLPERFARRPHYDKPYSATKLEDFLKIVCNYTNVSK